VNELLRMSGILNEDTMRDPRLIYTLEVDYAAFLRHLMFPIPRKAAAAVSAATLANALPSPSSLRPGASGCASGSADASVE
jgi:hypothetical protein